MPTPLDPNKKKLQSTYFVQDRHNKEEITRLTIQERMITQSMGGIITARADQFRQLPPRTRCCWRSRWMGNRRG